MNLVYWMNISKEKKKKKKKHLQTMDDNDDLLIGEMQSKGITLANINYSRASPFRGGDC